MLAARFGSVWGPRCDRSPAWACSLIRTQARRKQEVTARLDPRRGRPRLRRIAVGSFFGESQSRTPASLAASVTSFSHTPGLTCAQVYCTRPLSLRRHDPWSIKGAAEDGRSNQSEGQRERSPRVQFNGGSHRRPHPGRLQRRRRPVLSKSCQSPVSRSHSLIVRAILQCTSGDVV